MRSHGSLWIFGLIGIAAPATFAAVISLTLDDMVGRSATAGVKADDAILGEIVGSYSYARNTPDGELVFTDLEIRGTSLFDGFQKTSTISFLGSADRITSTMPALDDIRLGNRVVAFSAWSPTMGVTGMNGLVCGFAGLYNVIQNASGEDIVIGKGPDTAIEENISLTELRARIAEIRNRLEETDSHRGEDRKEEGR